MVASDSVSRSRRNSALKREPGGRNVKGMSAGLMMLKNVSQLFNDRPTSLRHKITGIYVFLLVLNVVAWAWALTAFHGQPALLGTALLAYTFGLRHAVDADHIAAIDNVTRKLFHIGRSPLTTGLFFSLGHSTVVVALSVAVAFTATALSTHFDALRGIGGLIGTSISAMFLFVLAFANLVVLASVIRTFRAVRRGEPLVETDLDLLLNNRGFLSRLLRPLFKLVSRSWHLYPVGFLFGLGFDTATEVALFGISAAQASHGVSFWSVLVLPILFTAGMSLVDTTDGILMLGAYRWAFVRPMRKLYYNITITFVSVVVAVLIGGIEVLDLLQDRLGLKGVFWDAIGSLNEHFGLLGYIVIGVFMVSWIVSIAIYKLRRYDDISVKTL
ncbi:MAG: nickel/cobalt transporter (NiCoT) family protein [Caballeronia mineralivorans]|nr:nickel/cobalt transporter (NiCoT) family protein [Caballeronia mineralivorans]